MKKNYKKFLIIIAIILIIIFACLIVLNLENTNNQEEVIDLKSDENLTTSWIEKEVKNSDRKVENATATVKKWDDMEIYEQYYEAEFDDNNYSSRSVVILDTDLEEDLGEVILTGYNEQEKSYYTTQGYAYSINDISKECAIAIQFEDDSDYYVYVNSYYSPETLDDLANDLNLKEYIDFGTIYYNYWETNSDGEEEYINIEFYNVDNDEIWDLLFYDTSLENIYDDNDSSLYYSERSSTDISISVDIPILGYENISISLTDQGYLLTNILDTGKGFYIGTDRVEEFLNYLIENYDGYKIIYVDDNEEIEEDTETEDRTLVTTNTTNGYVTEEYN